MVKVSVTTYKTKLAVSTTHQFPPRGGRRHPAYQMARLEMVLFMIQQCLFVALAFQIMPLSSLYEHMTQFFLLLAHQIYELGGLWSFLSFAVWIVSQLRNNKWRCIHNAGLLICMTCKWAAKDVRWIHIDTRGFRTNCQSHRWEIRANQTGYAGFEGWTGPAWAEDWPRRADEWWSWGSLGGNKREANGNSWRSCGTD